VSENIEVRSIVGRFLEHSRVYSFENDGDPELFCSSADCMSRNMFRRVETCFPIENKKLAERIRSELDLYLRDDSQAWIEQSDGTYSRAEGNATGGVEAQTYLLEQFKRAL
jgi:polyphosphate kinase